MRGGKATKVTVGDAAVLGDCCKQCGRFEAKMLFGKEPADITYVDVPSGFCWRIEGGSTLIVWPGWWRKLLHTLTGRWSLPGLG